MQPPSQPGEETRQYCQCSYCGGQFVIPEGTEASKLLCPHCREEIVDPEIVEVTRKKEESLHSPLPAQRRGKLTSSQQFRTRKRSAQKAQEEADTAPEPAAEPSAGQNSARRRIKSQAERQAGGLVTFFLLLASLGFLSIGGVLYYKTTQLPDVSELAVDAESLLVDNEDKNSRFNMSNFTQPGEILDGQTNLPAKDPVLESMKDKPIDKEDLDAAIGTLQQFHRAVSVEDRLKYVYDPDGTRSAMEKESKRENARLAPKGYPMQILDARVYHGVLIANVAYDDSKLHNVNFLYDKESDQWLLDWFSYSGYQDMTYGELLAQRPGKPVEVRVTIGMGANYERPFEADIRETNYEGKVYINVALDFGEGNVLRGYIDRHSKLAVQLTRELMIGSLPACVLISFPPAEANARPDQVIIEQLLHTSWLGKSARAVFDQSGSGSNSLD